ILVFFILFILMILCPLRSTLFPYTTLFRSSNRESMGTLGWSCGTELVWMVSQGAAGDRFAKRSPAAPCETEYSSNYTFEHIFSDCQNGRHRNLFMHFDLLREAAAELTWVSLISFATIR